MRTLHTRDRDDVVHVVHVAPRDDSLGRTACWLLFTWPIYSPIETARRWTGTEDHPTCLTCVVREAS